MYTCKFEFENYTGNDLLELLIAIDELGLESLYECMMKYFVENFEEYIKENSVKILQTIYKNEKFKELKNIYLEKFCNYGEELFKSNDFELLEKSVLLKVLKRDDFLVDDQFVVKRSSTDIGVFARLYMTYQSNPVLGYCCNL